MIKYELKCDSGHVFEAWFQDSSTYDRQRGRKQVHCPVCNSHKISKAPMAPRLARSSEARAADEAKQAQAARQALLQLREHVERNADYVGSEFPEEARKMHYGDAEHRNIYGEASPEEAKELSDEGIEVTSIPWIPRGDA
ncbi:DUF1178 family protein [Ferrovibrio sp.]|uniref:DUF1178 family protein n=1 Tax=Ferrovibrio sp. TaxID=1917215 RepID=UPI0025BDCFCC|nr:DUF1178 family protein [Ferrovibrio sp.]MBX3456480.1 DUF1178 family protein [Ferrovibrio sp.]